MESGVATSAPSALVPLETPFVEGQRYRLAGATELRTRLDLYVADAGGPWMRHFGLLVAFEAFQPPKTNAQT